MKKLLYRLCMPVSLLAVWLLLNDSLSAGNIVLGSLLAILLSWAASALRPLRAYPKRPLTIAVLMWHVALDIAKGNIAVARIIFLGRRSGATPGFVDIPLRIQDPHGQAMLACIVTYTPGTVWCGLSEDNHTLMLHVLDLKDESQWIETIQQRYERPLMEIFE